MLNVSSPIDFRTRIQRASETITKSAEKTSSGLRIDRASDDAAGLGISESLRTQVRGLHQAVSNIEQGISVVQIGKDGVGNRWTCSSGFASS